MPNIWAQFNNRGFDPSEIKPYLKAKACECNINTFSTLVDAWRMGKYFIRAEPIKIIP